MPTIKEPPHQQPPTTKKPAHQQQPAAPKKPAHQQPTLPKLPLQKSATVKKAQETTQEDASFQKIQKASPKEFSDNPIIEFENVTKTYHLYKDERSQFVGLFGWKKDDTYFGSVNANDGLSFQINKGEAVAFLGQNGAGKSTALKIITGVSFPTAGKATVKGKVSALLELNAGFDSQLTGRENISLRGQALGLSREEIKELEPGIIEFAELGVYIDQPIRTYSSGMKSRLGFAFAVSINPEIFVVDEALSVGDKRFKQKCVKRIREIMMDQDTTVLFVTHATGVAKEFCTRGIVLDQGEMVYDGPIEAAIAYYETYCGLAAAAKPAYKVENK
ncbi:MAG: ATP-binding cassette domain-containing protein [Eggerthellaceae bacterium]|nr:ATP-binding cassette domain-containing protein [Eggerthellaceae bacterium]